MKWLPTTWSSILPNLFGGCKIKPDFLRNNLQDLHFSAYLLCGTLIYNCLWYKSALVRMTMLIIPSGCFSLFIYSIGILIELLSNLTAIKVKALEGCYKLYLLKGELHYLGIQQWCNILLVGGTPGPNLIFTLDSEDKMKQCKVYHSQTSSFYAGCVIVCRNVAPV